MSAVAEVEYALCRSALYEALALGFRPPTEETVRRLASGAEAAGLMAAAEVLDDGLPALVRQLAAATDPGALAASYRQLFGHTARGQVPAYETEYGAGDLFRQPQELSDVGGFYAAFGLGPALGARERPDHVSCECEFLMFLARKEAFALGRGDDTMVETTRRAARLFLRDHVGRFVPALAERLRRAAPDGFYGALATLGDAFVRLECARQGVRPGPPSLRLREPVADAVPMACGGCELAASGSLPADGD